MSFSDLLIWPGYWAVAERAQMRARQAAEKLVSLKPRWSWGFAGAKQAAEKGRISGENLGKHTAGAEARFDSIAFMPGINPRPTARRSFSAACKARFILLAVSAPVRLRPGQALKSCSVTKLPRRGDFSRAVKSYLDKKQNGKLKGPRSEGRPLWSPAFAPERKRENGARCLCGAQAEARIRNAFRSIKKPLKLRNDMYRTPRE